MSILHVIKLDFRSSGFLEILIFHPSYQFYMLAHILPISYVSKMSSAVCSCCIWLNAHQTALITKVNSMNPDQTALHFIGGFILWKCTYFEVFITMVTLQNSSHKPFFHSRVDISMDSDQMASQKANWSGSTPVSKQDIYGVVRTRM